MTWPPIESLPVLLFWPAVLCWLLVDKWWMRRWKRRVLKERREVVERMVREN